MISSSSRRRSFQRLPLVDEARRDTPFPSSHRTAEITIAPPFSATQSCCARILLSVQRTLPHGASLWLQPRSPVVHDAVERVRGPDPPDARVPVGRPEDARAAPASARPAGAPAALARHPAPEESHRAARAAESLQLARAAVAIHPRESLAVAPLRDARALGANALRVRVEAHPERGHGRRWLV